MDQELEALGERVERMLALVRRLSDENARLAAQLAECQDSNRQLEQRISDARARVEAALSRLPAAAESDAQQA